jgi:hypothetical protein
MKTFLFTILISASTVLYAQTSGIYQTYAITSTGSNAYYAGGANSDGATSFNGLDLGDFTSSSTLTLNGGEIKSWKNSGGNVTGAKLYYRIYESSNATGSFTEVDLPYNSELGSGNQKWTETAEGINILSGLTSTTNYTLEVYFKITTDTGDKYDNNSGNNFKATFDYSHSVTASVNITGNAGWRLMSSPITTSFSDILNEVWTQGATAGADDTNGNPNVFTWSNSSIDGANTNWSGVTNLTTNLSAGTGFLVYIYADDDFDGSDDSFPKNLSVNGSENTIGTAPTINSNANGWTLLGNPFATTIDFDLITTNDVTSTVYIWDDATSAWKTWNGTTGDITNGLIKPFQGFFIKNSSSVSSATTSFPSSAKSTGGTFYGKTFKNSIKNIRLELNSEDLTNSLWLEFSDSGDRYLTLDNDALELQPYSNNYLQLASLKNETLLDIAHLPIPVDEYYIPIDYKSTVSGNAALSVSNFNQPLDTWDVSKVTSLSSTFANAIAFDQDISTWNVSRVEKMDSTFFNTSEFNQNVSNWQVAEVNDMKFMFSGSKLFNQDIGNWNVGAVLDMSGMFYGAKSFNQELVDWCVSTLIIEPDLFSFDSALREENKPLWGTCPNN